MHACMYVSMYLWIYVSLDLWISGSVDLWIYGSMDLCIYVSILSMQDESGGSVVLSIAFLKSYEHMGVFRVNCESGCTCEEKTMDGYLELKQSQTHLADLDVSKAGKHNYSI